MSTRSDLFVSDWVHEHVHNVPGLQDIPEHARSLAERLQNDAQADGIYLVELEETVGDPYDYVLNEFEQIYDPDLGFKDGRDDA